MDLSELRIDLERHPIFPILLAWVLEQACEFEREELELPVRLGVPEYRVLRTEAA